MSVAPIRAPKPDLGRQSPGGARGAGAAATAEMREQPIFPWPILEAWRSWNAKART